MWDFSQQKVITVATVITPAIHISGHFFRVITPILLEFHVSFQMTVTFSRGSWCHGVICWKDETYLHLPSETKDFMDFRDELQLDIFLWGLNSDFCSHLERIGWRNIGLSWPPLSPPFGEWLLAIDPFQVLKITCFFWGGSWIFSAPRSKPGLHGSRGSFWGLSNPNTTGQRTTGFLRNTKHKLRGKLIKLWTT